MDSCSASSKKTRLRSRCTSLNEAGEGTIRGGVGHRIQGDFEPGAQSRGQSGQSSKFEATPAALVAVDGGRAGPRLGSQVM